ncbi:MAG TPA: exosortase A [Allosphingosinicella sp.]|nr:exosortase A [Allosphingosinicella sp.]
MTAHAPVAAAEPAVDASDGWRLHLTGLVGAAAAILLLFHRDVAAMVGLWWNSSTYNHCLLIPPIIAWMVAQRLPELRRLAPRAWLPGLLLVAAGAAGWLLGEAGGVALARHAGIVAMLQGAAVACLGKTVARGLAFPIFYGLFLIPAGEELVAPMQTLTAEMCMALLALAGIPAHIEGIFITTPGGYFEVAEACSGVKFLVAMIAYGALAANLCFASAWRRALFMLAAVAIPIAANGVRAWGTIYIAELTDTDFAAGFDHVVYGWIFFAIVMALLMAVGWRFFDRKPGDPWFDPRRLQPEGTAPGGSDKLVAAALCAALVAALPLGWSAAVASAGARKAPAEIVLPEVPGWDRIAAERGRPWQPHYAGADMIRMGRYRDSTGREVDLAIAVFARQEEGRELVAYGQGPAGPDSGWAWTAAASAPPGGRADRIASHGTVREVATFYRVGGIVTGSGYKVKLETMKTRLFGGPQRAVAVLVASQAPAEGADPRPAIDAFLAALGPIDRVADGAAGGQD